MQNKFCDGRIKHIVQLHLSATKNLPLHSRGLSISLIRQAKLPNMPLTFSKCSKKIIIRSLCDSVNLQRLHFLNTWTISSIFFTCQNEDLSLVQSLYLVVNQYSLLPDDEMSFWFRKVTENYKTKANFGNLDINLDQVLKNQHFT